MKFSEILKKYWFVGVIGILLIVFIGIYGADAYKNREIVVSNKEVDGKYVVYSVDGKDIIADDFYNTLYDKNGLSCAFVQFQRAVLDNAIETTDDMKEIATNYAAYIYQTYGEDYVLDQLQQMGYVNGTDDLIQYYIDSQKQTMLVNEYLTANSDTYLKPFIEENDPRVIYHILVKVADITETKDADGNSVFTANPTTEEKVKLDAVLKGLETKSFEDVAVELSDDSSGKNGGYIGYIGNDNYNNYYQIFSKTAMQLKNDEVSDVITSQAGYHILWNAGNSIDVLLQDSNFMQTITEKYPNLTIKAVMEKADLTGFEIVDSSLKELIQSQLESEVNQ